MYLLPYGTRVLSNLYACVCCCSPSCLLAMALEQASPHASEASEAPQFPRVAPSPGVPAAAGMGDAPMGAAAGFPATAGGPPALGGCAPVATGAPPEATADDMDLEDFDSADEDGGVGGGSGEVKEEADVTMGGGGAGCDRQWRVAG